MRRPASTQSWCSGGVLTRWLPHGSLLTQTYGQSLPRSPAHVPTQLHPQLHNMPEGLVTFVGYMDSITSGITTAVAIAVSAG
mgnify:CR=1 FL=1